MEQNSIGSFIAALRKASGLTQKDLADRLHVSDKTISRWERDEGSPDLTAIPALAEIFGVTCDELLRGRRNPPAQQEQAAPAEEKTTPRGNKERQRLLKVALTRYSTLTYIAIGIAALGLIVALICNEALREGAVGFLLGIGFFGASAICQAIAISRTLAEVDDDLLTPEELATFRQRVFHMASLSFGCAVAMLGYTIPILISECWHSIADDLLIPFGVLSAAAALVLFLILRSLIAVPMLIRRGFLLPSEEEAGRLARNRKRLKRCIAVLVALWVITWILLFFVSIDRYQFATAESFQDYDSFVAFMEEPRISHRWDFDIEPATSVNSQEPEKVVSLEDSHGNILCSYHPRNRDIAQIIYGEEPSLLPIQVYTLSEYYASAQITATIQYALYGAFVLEAAVIALFYRVRRER